MIWSQPSLFYLIKGRIILYCLLSYHVMSHCILSCCMFLCHILYYTMLYYIDTSNYIKLYWLYCFFFYIVFVCKESYHNTLFLRKPMFHSCVQQPFTERHWLIAPQVKTIDYVLIGTLKNSCFFLSFCFHFRHHPIHLSVFFLLFSLFHPLLPMLSLSPTYSVYMLYKYSVYPASFLPP